MVVGLHVALFWVFYSLHCLEWYNQKIEYESIVIKDLESLT